MSEDDLHWPALPLAAWEATRATLHMWTQIVGKVRLALAPYENHWWQVTLYPSARGLRTSAIPYRGDSFEILFDFIDHQLRIEKSDGRVKTVALAPGTVADFYAQAMAGLRSLGIDVKISPLTSEIPDPVRLDQDRMHAVYDPDAARCFWRALASVAAVLREFRGGFIGKSSPVHFFWGGFDLAVTRFSGRRAPPIPGADAITREGYSHEVSSVGWWPGDGAMSGPAFYAYASPEPPGFASAPVRPAGAAYDTAAGQFRLSYDAVRRAASPRAAILDFCQSTYEAAATLGKWDRAALERSASE
jgi:Family of unknown function (DUF5996)